MNTFIRTSAFLIVVIFCFNTVFGQDNFRYQTPPKDILDLALAEPTPAVSIDKKGEWMLLLQRSEFPTIEELAQPELRIGGLRINPNNFSPSRAGSSTNIQIKNIKSKQVFTISGLPADLKASSVQWSPDERKFAFINSTNDRVDLYVVDISARTARKVNSSPLNTVLGGSYQWAGNNLLIYKTVPEKNSLPGRPKAPSGPIVQESLGKAAASRTYQDLIQNPYDEALFEYYATAQLVKNDLTKETRLGAPAIYRSVNVSPDNNFILLNTISKPFSYLIPAQGFPHTVSVMNMNGEVINTLAKNPSSEGAPIGFDDVVDFPRSFNWRDDEPATITYVKALDNGLGRKKADFRDAVYAIDLRNNINQPKELFITKRRFGGITWGTKDVAVFYERTNADRRVRMNRYNPTTGQVDSLFERSSNDAYGDIGFPMTTKNEFGQQTLILLNGNELLLRSQGASTEGDMPLVQTFNITNGQKKILWRSQAPHYENVVEVIDPKNLIFITSHEGVTEAPNFYIRDLKKKTSVAITDFKNPYKQLEGIYKEKISYKRDDGINLTGNLYLPKGYDAKKDGALPILIWAYPREYKSADDAAQVRGSRYTFTRINYGSPIFWVTQGYAVLDNAEMPIVGEGGKEPNDNFIPQLQLNAHAAIRKLAEMGVGDSTRVGVGGHSYGAFMTSNLLAHTNLFKAGIARSGAYNRTLTPFGFQGEERTYWEAPEVYNNMSPFMFAHKIKTPLLMIHGEMDNNSGTFPIQSERLYNAIKGHGGTVRFVILPYESHGYAARENILHMLWEQNQWLEKYVKSRDKNPDNAKSF